MLEYENISPLDYDKLKQYGLEYIQQIGHKLWTDYNVHDPGVTFLEALCFSLTDLGFRTSFAMVDLLTSKGELHPKLNGSLFPAAHILSSNPTTITDYRKFILEHVPGVRNVWMKRVEKKIDKATPTNIKEELRVKGFYDTTIELEENVFLHEIQRYIRRNNAGQYTAEYAEKYTDVFRAYVKNMLQKHRNLCEDFVNVEVSNPVKIGICVEIELDDAILSQKDLDEKQILQHIYDAVDQYISPSISYYTITELLQKGKTPEEIYQGCLPRLGFVDYSELEHFEKKIRLNESDIIAIILKIDGVKSIHHFHFKVKTEDLEKGLVTVFGSQLILNEPNIHHLSFTSLFNNHRKEDGHSGSEVLTNEVVFLKNWFPFYPKKTEIVVGNNHRKIIDNLELQLPIPSGRYRNLDRYFSFQQYLPHCYKMDKDSCDEEEDGKKDGQKLQLKGYLTFFDQLLADYLAQLNSLQDYFSLDESKNIDPTYFYKQLTEEEICNINKIISDYQEGYAETKEQALHRRDKLVNHLLARFNDTFANYAALSFALGEKDKVDKFDLKENIEDKKRYLKRYPEISGNRAKAHDYTEEWSLSGIEDRILTRLGINNPQKQVRLAPSVISSYKRKTSGIIVRKFVDNRNETFENTFGLHVMEHILLVPHDGLTGAATLRLSEDGEKEKILHDPYSFRVTVVLPGWLSICQNYYFRQYVESVIHEEIPAHIASKICWLSPNVMYDLERAYVDYLKVMKVCPHPLYTREWIQKQNGAIEHLVSVFNRFRNIYMPMKLDGDIFSGPDEHYVKLDYCNISEDMDWEKQFESKKHR